jgi:hypothetical protein
MRKLGVTIIIGILLLGILYFNGFTNKLIDKNQVFAQETTLRVVIDKLDSGIKLLTEEEQNLLMTRISQQQVNDAITLMKQWKALLNVTTEVYNILGER